MVIFLKIYSPNLYLLIKKFNPFTFKVITGTIGFMSLILLFVFYMSCIFCFLISPLLSYFVLIRYFLVYPFNILVISLTIYFSVIFLVVSLGIVINILIYKILLWINTNLISLLCKHCCNITIPLLFYPIIVINYIFIHCVHTNIYL